MSWCPDFEFRGTQACQSGDIERAESEPSTQAHMDATANTGLSGWLGSAIMGKPTGQTRCRRDCHFVGTLSSSLLKRLLKGGAIFSGVHGTDGSVRGRIYHFSMTDAGPTKCW